jgi:RimJ/RimL family protein N-acetyltransferase
MSAQLRYPNLFAGPLVRLAALDAERDSALIARWSGDTEFRRLLDSDPVRYQLASEVKTDIEKRAERPNAFPFGIHTAADDKFIGFVSLWVRDWSSAEAFVGIGIGDRAYWSRGYGSDAMRLALRFAFHELNLERVSLEANGDNARAIRAYEKCGFVHEGTQREWEGRDGRRAHIIAMGILRADWERALDQPLAQL